MAEREFSSLRARLRPPALPDHDVADPVESSVIRALTRSWGIRATVKKREPDLDDLFDPDRRDYPDELIPFRTHRRYRDLDENRRARLRAWAWIAYNKNVVDIEQFVVNPGFAAVTNDALGIGPADTVVLGVMQAMVDEQYHTLMHHNASALTRRRRGWVLPESVLPASRTVRAHRDAVAGAESPRAEALVRLAFTTVAETSISAYLALLTEDDTLQPVNRATVALHRRDELCHASLAAEILRIVFTDLGRTDRRVLLDALAAGIVAFTGSDTATWAAIVEHERIPGAQELIAETAAAARSERVVQDCSAIRSLCTELGVADDLHVDW
ncbi:AurF N-oxygenase family protein [Rhodococcus phenolicus]|uniref:AurF N-oxygenase family protein n=1 Tax=Rhodococcus phenolicus TaxID=263849 RepID=UPI0008340BE2|nr:diiron oxygenase [Rhodococcus phenolicus]